MNYQWYPGHMTKARRMMQEDIKLIDLVIELLDARVPFSSRNPDIDKMGRDKARLILLNKSDLADEKSNEAWVAFFEAKGYCVRKINSRSGAGLKSINAAVLEACHEKIERDKRKGIKNRPVRAMVVGIPNVGKSTFINAYAGKACAKTGNKPGVTKGKQWIRLNKGLELLDTPGILWPKFEDPKAGLNLAFCGSIRDEILDTEGLALELLGTLAAEYPTEIEARYKVEVPEKLKMKENAETDDEGHAIYDEEEYNEDGFPISPVLLLLNDICRKRGWILPGKKLDYERAGRTILDEFRSGLIGHITLEKTEL